MKKHKILVIGLDGATWKIINPLIRKGKLPFLAKLKKSSSYGKLISTIPPITASAWASMQTGMNPGKHGIFGFVKHRDRGGEYTLISANDINGRNFWEYSSLFDKNSLVINMPVTYPAYISNGVLISSFLTPYGETPVYPKEYKRILDKHDYEVDITIQGKYGGLPKNKLTSKDKNIFLGHLKRISKKRIEVYNSFLRETNYDFQFLMFKETDVAQHIFWDSPELEQYYFYLDKLLENLYQNINTTKGNNSSLIIVSDHGFHKIADVEFSAYEWMRREGFITDRETPKKSEFSLYTLFKKYFKSKWLRKYIRDNHGQLRNKIIASEERKIKKEHSFEVASEGIYFYKQKNIKYLNKLVKELTKVEHKGIKVFKLVKKSSDIYSGANIKKAPDIVWLTNKEFSINVSFFSKVLFNKNLTHIKGNHISDIEGIFLANGDLFKKGKILDLDIYDIFPLSCYCLGIPIPEDIDGKLPTDILKNSKLNIETEKQWVEGSIDKEINDLN